MSKRNFFSAVLKQGFNIGAIAPSSKFLVNKMLEPINFNEVKCIVEFGPGTGSITHELLNKMPTDSILIVFEINKEFCDLLQKTNDSRLKIISDTAENLEHYLKQYNISKVDYIISSLPFALIPNGIVRNILRVTKKTLRPMGRYIQYQYSLNAFRKLKNTFAKVDVNFAAINIPPAFVFICEN